MARILLIEDMPSSRALVGKLLAAEGHEVLLAERAEHGITVAQQTLPDLVLMDLGLPDMDGWQALTELRGQERTAALRVVAFTAHAMVGDRSQALEAGFDGYLSKPVDVATFAQTVRQLLA
jgi:CheY-like chemotaxis protein